MIKGWFVWIGEEWGDWVHGETATEAKKRFWAWWGSEAEEWINMQPIRCPRFDGVPITRESIAEGLTNRQIQEWAINYRDLICDCELCQEAGDESKKMAVGAGIEGQGNEEGIVGMVAGADQSKS
jgi:hypothetical protein